MRKQIFGTDIATSVREEESCRDKVEEEPIVVSSSEEHLFRTVHFCAKENLPNSMVNTQLQFLRASGVDAQTMDIHADTVKQVQQSLVYVCDQVLSDELDQSKFYGLIIDETTDLSEHKKLAIYIRYVLNSGEVKNELLSNIRISDGTASTIIRAILDKIKAVGLDITNLVGLGSDGASVMFGRKSGVGIQLAAEALFLTHVHCVAHRLALACSDAAKDTPYLKAYRDTLKNLYIHVTGSGIRQYKLEEMQKIMEEPQLRLKDPISIRWLAMESAVHTVHKCYGSIVAYLQSNDGKNSIGDNVAEGLLKSVLHYKFPAFTAVLSDILKVVGVLSKQLQSENIDLSEFTPMKESAVGRLEGLKNLDGECVSEFKNNLTTTGTKVYFKGIQLSYANERSQMENIKEKFITSVVDNINDRLRTDNTPQLSAFQLFEPKGIPMTNIIKTQHLETLADFYQLDKQALKLEYSGVSALLNGSYRHMTFSQISKQFLTRHQSEYPLTSQVCKIGLCIPVSSVACERGFSLQNRIKVKSRTSLTPENLEVLMKLANSPGIHSFPYSRAIKHWRIQKRRRLARLYQPTKSVE